MSLLDTQASGKIGVGLGYASLGAAGIGLYRLVTDPDYLTVLWIAAHDARLHESTQADVHAWAQLIAAGIPIVVAAIVSLHLSRLSPSPRALGLGNAAPQAANLPGKDTQ